MTLKELVLIHDIDMKINFSTYSGKWYLTLNIEVKDGPILRSVSKHRDTPEEAINAYINIIKGKKVVMYASQAKRREFIIPETLTYMEKNNGSE